MAWSFSKTTCAASFPSNFMRMIQLEVSAFRPGKRGRGGKHPVHLLWDGLHELSLSQPLAGAGFRKELAIYVRMSQHHEQAQKEAA